MGAGSCRRRTTRAPDGLISGCGLGLLCCGGVGGGELAEDLLEVLALAAQPEQRVALLDGGLEQQRPQVLASAREYLERDLVVLARQAAHALHGGNRGEDDFAL